MFHKLLIALISAGMTLSAAAYWRSDDIQVSFLTTKLAPQSSTATELNTFSPSSAVIDFEGKMRAEIELSSLDTGITVRNQRIQEMLFSAVKSGQLLVKASVAMDKIERLKAGQQLRLSQSLHLTFGAAETDVTANLLVTKLSEKRFSVLTLKPIVVELRLLDVDKGVNDLREIAGLEAIGMQTPVSFNGTFTLVSGANDGLE
ncbi:hypothetical protein L0B52_03910 [Suttonella sp. R2A3]|uniref:hypothetical protein n=1 Tax=Suttonella sp. R2A3 TaxID=2908648 RepID=UPI001F3AF200|nr:hypothetical protein [Suttonella sp. R2A3]UJF25303.1 hypothetical protein L0B52_03910 [Suttonella sp. R2A3]